MIQRIIGEIRTAIDNDCYIIALMGALTLPDICGKSAYPELKVGARYIKWCDTYVYPAKVDVDPNIENFDCGITNVNGQIIYSLRCSLLHQGSSEIDGEKCEVEDFELLIQPQNEFGRYVDNIGAIWANDDFEHRERHMSLHIRNICTDLCNAAERYYQNHRDEFDFAKYKISQINPNADYPWEYRKEVSL